MFAGTYIRTVRINFDVCFGGRCLAGIKFSNLLAFVPNLLLSILEMQLCLSLPVLGFSGLKQPILS